MEKDSCKTAHENLKMAVKKVGRFYFIYHFYFENN